MNNKGKIKHNKCMKRFIFYSILIFVFSIFIGFFYSRIWKLNNENNVKEANDNVNRITETFAMEEKIAFNSNFALKKYYDECGHFEFNYSELPKELINLTESELEEIYPDWKVEKFSSTDIVLSKEVNTICNEHYVLKLDENSINVYHIEQNGDKKLYKTTNISKEYLTKEDISNLEKGIYVYGKGNINSVIEDFE